VKVLFLDVGGESAFFYHKSWLLKKSFFNPLDQPFNKNKINFENIFGFLYIYTHQDFPGEVF